MSDAEVGYGATLGVGDGSSPESFTNVAEVVEIQPASKEVADAEVTHLKSPDAHKEYKPGMIEPGEWTLECRWLPDDATQSDASGGLLGILYSRSTKNFKYTGPSGYEEEFTGYVKSHSPSSVEGDSALNLSVTIKVTGKATHTAAA